MISTYWWDFLMQIITRTFDTWFSLRSLARSLATEVVRRMIQRTLTRIRPLNRCKIRRLSDKPRNRKWTLPPIPQAVSTLQAASNAAKLPPAAKIVRPRTLRGRPPLAEPNTETANSPKLESWAIQKLALKQKYPDGYLPQRKVSPDALEGIRILHRQVLSL
jgi:hypothetical protein